VLSANISTGNIGANVRNDFTWYDDWKAKLTETETFINDMLRNTSPQRSIWYSNEIVEQESARDHVKRTTELRIEAVLHTHAVFPVSVQRTVQAVYDGLQTTNRVQAWSLNGWPRQSVTNTNPFNRTWGAMIPIVFEVLNGQGQVIGRQTVEMDSRYSFSGTRLEGPGTAFTTVRFTGVKGDDIHYPLSIRIASINGRQPEEAGISRIAPMSAQQLASNKNFTIYNGAIRPSSNNRNLGAIAIPNELWGERVTVIANGAFENRGLTRVNIPSSVIIIEGSAFANNQLTGITIPSSVTIIGTSAFANNQLTNIIISSSVTTIEASTFANNRLSSVNIPEGIITIGDRAFSGNRWTTTVPLSDGYYRTTLHGLSRITIANSVTSIGQEAFFTSINERINHPLKIVVEIGANVNIRNNAVGDGFETFYYRTGKLAGAYNYDGYDWEKYDNNEDMKQKIASKYKNENIFLNIAVGTILVGAVVFLVYLLIPSPSD
jgi:hypothetical protein